MDKVYIKNPCDFGNAILKDGYLSPPTESMRVCAPWKGGPDVKLSSIIDGCGTCQLPCRKEVLRAKSRLK